jgi:hypothetical protein
MLLAGQLTAALARRTVMRLTRLAVAASIALLASACSSGYRGALRDFDQARYPEALEELRRTESELPGLNAREQARYALYRGLTHLALGDRRATLRWLQGAKRALDACPELLSDEDAGRLTSAWSHLQTDDESGP